jgi:hypothetical protein
MATVPFLSKFIRQLGYLLIKRFVSIDLVRCKTIIESSVFHGKAQAARRLIREAIQHASGEHTILAFVV